MIDCNMHSLVDLDVECPAYPIKHRPVELYALPESCLFALEEGSPNLDIGALLLELVA